MNKVVFLIILTSFLLGEACIDKSVCRKANPPGNNKRKKLELAPGFK